MHYAIFDSTGNLVESLGDEESARKALDRIVDAEPKPLSTSRCSSTVRMGCRSATPSSHGPPPASTDIRSVFESITPRTGYCSSGPRLTVCEPGLRVPTKRAQLLLVGVRTITGMTRPARFSYSANCGIRSACVW